MNFIQKELDIIKKTSTPNTIQSLRDDFRTLGIKLGDLLLVHSSLSQLGWTLGGPISVIDALLSIIGKKGTLVMPSFSSGNTDPQEWQYPPVPKTWHSIIRDNMPPFHVDKTPTRGMGIIAETFRKYPDVIRSNHPTSSFCAQGKYARYITENHRLEYDLGERSPLAKIYELNGKILLLGVGHSSNTSIHLAEYQSDYGDKYYKKQGSSVMVNEKREWVEWNELNLITDDFEELGGAFEQKVKINHGKVGLAETKFFSQRNLVDFAIVWIRKNRTQKED